MEAKLFWEVIALGFFGCLLVLQAETTEKNDF